MNQLQEANDFVQWESELALPPDAKVNRDLFKEPEEVGAVALTDSVRITMDDSVRITASEDSVRITAHDDSVRITAPA